MQILIAYLIRCIEDISVLRLRQTFSRCSRIRKFLFIYSVCTSSECLGRGDKPEATSTEYPSYVHISSYMRIWNILCTIHGNLNVFSMAWVKGFCDRSTPFGSTSDIHFSINDNCLSRENALLYRFNKKKLFFIKLFSLLPV